MQGSHGRAYRGAAPLASRQPGLPLVGPHISQQLRVILVAAAVAAVAASSIIPVEEEGMYDPDVFECNTIDDAGHEPGHERAAIRWDKYRWPKGLVPYAIDTSINPTRTETILKAMDEYHSKTCIRFVERTTEDNYLWINDNKEGCWSLVGMRVGKQNLNLDNGCYSLGIIIHELMHSLGFHHEHNRPDRDDYVTVYLDNVKDGKKKQFNIPKDQQYAGEGYNYHSIMHTTGIYSHSKKKGVLKTIVPKDPDVILKPGKKELPQRDANQINNLYAKECARRQ